MGGIFQTSNFPKNETAHQGRSNHNISNIISTINPFVKHFLVNRGLKNSGFQEWPISQWAGWRGTLQGSPTDFTPFDVI